jgi:hypothetical protein
VQARQFDGAPADVPFPVSIYRPKPRDERRRYSGISIVRSRPSISATGWPKIFSGVIDIDNRAVRIDRDDCVRPFQPAREIAFHSRSASSLCLRASNWNLCADWLHHLLHRIVPGDLTAEELMTRPLPYLPEVGS